MKKELIKTPDYLLVVDDSKITNNDWFIPVSGFGWEINKPKQASKLDGYHNKHCRKLIAHLPLNGSPVLKGVPLLPQMDVGVFAYPTHFEFEMVDYGHYEVGVDDFIKHGEKPKTLTNSQGQTVACGKYIYEL